MVWVMVDIGPIMVDIIHLTMVVMVVMVMVVVLPPLCTFKKRTARKRLQNHSPTIGTTAVIRKAIIHKSKSVLTVGYQLLRSQPHSKDNHTSIIGSVDSLPTHRMHEHTIWT